MCICDRGTFFSMILIVFTFSSLVRSFSIHFLGSCEAGQVRHLQHHNAHSVAANIRGDRVRASLSAPSHPARFRYSGTGFFLSYGRIHKNKVVLASKPYFPVHFRNCHWINGFSAKTTLFLRLRQKEKKNWNSNMLQAQQLSISKKDAPTKFNFWPRRTLRVNLKVDFRGLIGDSR